MKNKIFGFILFLVFAFFLYQLAEIYIYLGYQSRPVLSTPYGLLMTSLSTKLSYSFFYYRPYELNPLNQPELASWWFALSPNIAAIVFFQLSCLYILLFAKIRKTESAFLIFAMVISVQYILFFDFISRQFYVFFFYLLTLLSNVAFLHLYLNLLNRKIPLWSKGLGILVLTLVTILNFPGSIHDEIKMFKIMGFTHLVTFVSGLGILLYDELNPVSRYTIQRKGLRRVFSLTSLLIIFIPSMSYLLPLYKNIPASIYANVIFYVPAVFPLLFIILSLHNSYIFFKRPVKTWYLRVIYFIFYLFLYGIILVFESHIFLTQRSIIFLYIASVFAFIFIFDALRLFTQITVNFYLNYRKMVFEEHVTDLFQYSLTPFGFEDGLNKFIKMLESGLGASKVVFLLNGDLFGGWISERVNIKLIREDDPIWSYRKKRFILRPKLLLTLMDKGYPGVFLRRHSGVMMIFFPEFKSGIILSEKASQTPYISEDLKYIFDLVRQIEPVLENFKLLIKNIETRKFNKELEIVSRVQKKHMIPRIKNDRVRLNYVIKPYRHVTGDYLEVYSPANDQLIIFLGDASGHGLASAYFTGLVKALIDGYFQTGNTSISGIFNLINSALCSKQSSSSFMTMSALDIKLINVHKKYYAEIEYLNAGQHAPYIYLKGSGKMIPLADNQQVLGVFESNYTTKKMMINESFRIILTSDGAFEIFNEEGTILGDQKFAEWIIESSGYTSEDQKTFLMNKIKNYSYDPEMYDDISILIADVKLD